MEKEKYYCTECGTELPKEYNPKMCCNAFDCGCMGLPTNPPICSEECWNKASKPKTGQINKIN